MSTELSIRQFAHVLNKSVASSGVLPHTKYGMRDSAGLHVIDQFAVLVIGSMT
jgi:hypothetical protein